MGNGKHSGLRLDKYPGVKDISNKLAGKRIDGAKQYDLNMNVQYDRFNSFNVSDDTVTNAVNNIEKLINYLGVNSPSELPNVWLTTNDFGINGVFTIGRCRLDQTIELNPAHFNVHHLQQEPGSMFGPNEVGNMNTPIHEYAHAIEAEFVQRAFPNSSADRYNAWNNCLFSKEIINRALTKMNVAETNWKQYAREISNYATTDYSECLAEVCGHYFTSKPSQRTVFESTVLKVLRSEYRKLVKKND